MTPEQRFKKRIRTALVLAGWDVQTIETSTGRGVPDLNVSHSYTGEFWLELKYGDATPKIRPEQNAWLTRAAAHGRRCAVVWSWEKGVCDFYIRWYTKVGVQYTASGNNLSNLLIEHVHA